VDNDVGSELSEESLLPPFFVHTKTPLNRPPGYHLFPFISSFCLNFFRSPVLHSRSPFCETPRLFFPSHCSPETTPSFFFFFFIASAASHLSLSLRSFAFLGHRPRHPDLGRPSRVLFSLPPTCHRTKPFPVFPARTSGTLFQANLPPPLALTLPSPFLFTIFFLLRFFLSIYYAFCPLLLFFFYLLLGDFFNDPGHFSYTFLSQLFHNSWSCPLCSGSF